MHYIVGVSLIKEAGREGGKLSEVEEEAGEGRGRVRFV
jgi:hypothetical protein